LISGGVLILSFCADFELFLLFFAILLGFVAFRDFCWFLRFFFFLMTFLSFSWLFRSSSYASWDLGFELQTLCFCCQWTHKGGD
jgi:hypothetical protein